MPFNNKELEDIENQNVEEDAMDMLKKDDNFDEEQDCQNPFAVIGENCCKVFDAK